MGNFSEREQAANESGAKKVSEIVDAAEKTKAAKALSDLLQEKETSNTDPSRGVS